MEVNYFCSVNVIDMKPEPKIAERSVEAVARALRGGCFKRILVIAGAGISTGSGIPDFRSPNGLYNTLKRRGFKNPECVFTWNWFDSNRAAFYEIMREVMPPSAEPGAAHRFLKWLDDAGMLLRVITQNIDGLEQKTGIHPDRIVQIHGSSRDLECDACGQARSSEECSSETVPVCTACGRIMRPDIVFFGEQVRMHDRCERDFEECDCLIVMGTSLNVYPCAGFVNDVGVTVPRVFINDVTLKWPFDRKALDNRFRFNADPIRDVMLKGDAQDICARLMGETK